MIESSRTAIASSHSSTIAATNPMTGTSNAPYVPPSAPDGHAPIYPISERLCCRCAGSASTTAFRDFLDVLPPEPALSSHTALATSVAGSDDEAGFPAHPTPAPEELASPPR